VGDIDADTDPLEDFLEPQYHRPKVRSDLSQRTQRGLSTRMRPMRLYAASPHLGWAGEVEPERNRIG
jgi:hypothetical protein